MRAEYVIRIRITRPAARLLIGLSLVAFPSTRLSPADPLARELTITTSLPAPRAVYSSIQVSGKAIFGQGTTNANSALNVALSTTSCIPVNLAGRYVQHTEMANRLAAILPAAQDPNRLSAGYHDRCRGAVPPDGANADPRRPAMRVLTSADSPMTGTTTANVDESPDVKLFVRGDVWVDRLFWYRNALPGVNTAPDFEIMYWPNEIVGFAATNCANGFNATTGLCNYGTFNPNAQEIVLNYFVKNGTGSVANWGFWARHTGTGIGGSVGTSTPGSTTPRLRIHSNTCSTTNSGPVFQQCIGACNPPGSTYAVRINCTNVVGNCPQGQSCTPSNFAAATCGSTGNPYFDIWTQCRFHVGQNVSSNFPYKIDPRLMCVKISNDEWNTRCQGQAPATRWQECNRRCRSDVDTNPNSQTCPFNPNLHGAIASNGGLPVEDCNYNPGL